MIAEPRHEQRGSGVHGRGRNHSAPRRHGPAVTGDRVERLILRPARQSFDDRAGSAEIDLSGLQWQIEAPGEWIFAAQCLAQRTRSSRAELNRRGADRLLHRHRGRLENGTEEARHVLTAADGATHALQFGGNGLRAKGVLSKTRPACLLAVAGAVPSPVNLSPCGIQVVDEIQAELTMVRARPFAEQRALEECLGNLFAGTGHRDRDTEIALDRLVLADQHFEDHAVDGVVGAVVGDDAHLALLLAEAVHASFALLVAGRIPGEVVVQHRVEVLLQVDALGETVGADEHELTRLPDQLRDPSLALGRRKQARYRLDAHLGGQDGPQLLGHVIRGIDEAAEDDGVEPVVEQRLDLAGSALQFEIVCRLHGFRPASELEQPAPSWVTTAFRVGAGAEVDRHGVVGVALIEHGAAPDFNDILAFGLIDGGAAA